MKFVRQCYAVHKKVKQYQYYILQLAISLINICFILTSARERLTPNAGQNDSGIKRLQVCMFNSVFYLQPRGSVISTNVQIVI